MTGVGNVDLTGQEITSGLGSPTTVAASIVQVEGQQITSALADVLVWAEVDTNQTPNYTEVDESQTPGFSTISTSQSPGYTEIEAA